MHRAVKLGLDKTEGLAYPAFEPEELDFWLNDSVQRFIKTRYSGNNLPGTGFEQSQKRIDDLYTIVKEAVIVPVLSTEAYSKPNSYTIEVTDFPDDYMLFLNDETTISFTHRILNTEVILRTGVTECTSDSYYTKISDPYGEHILHMYTARPLRLFSFVGIELITDGTYEIDNYFLRYISRPAVLDSLSITPVDCDLPEHTHSEIVEMTVNKLLENIEAPRYQTQTVELTKVE
jgi:hypothetical protein